jgi:ADP-dependent NAD(P)H-hydrate dehydratase / NAD(P)H-hydrate epimerase
MPACVVNAEESVALDAAAIASGIPSRALMRAAAFNAASVLCTRYPQQLRQGVTVVTGPGNNGGDGWALASALDTAGVNVQVREIACSRTPDATAERELATRLIATGPLAGGVIVDAMLGTGNTGDLRGTMLDAASEIAVARARGAVVVALDLPSGVDATHGVTQPPRNATNDGTAHRTVVADLTVSFGSCKRGSLMSRAACGEIIVIDIGLGGTTAGLPSLVDAAFVRAKVPAIAPDAHKGTRRSVAVVAGSANMGGAAILAATGAMRSGVGMVQVITAPGNVAPMHTRIPEALVAPLDKASATIQNWADAVLIGPGLGRDDATRALIRSVLSSWRGPVVVDAGALNAFDSDMDALSDALRGRPSVITPHPAELGKLIGRDVQYVLDNRFDIGIDVARKLGAAVLLKGTPTVISDPDGGRLVVASGTQVLATGGSGDALGGIVATLLAQGCAPSAAAACAAWVHGRAADLTPGVRGYRLTDVLDRLPQAWALEVPAMQYPVLASLPALA